MTREAAAVGAQRLTVLSQLRDQEGHHLIKQTPM